VLRAELVWQVGRGAGQVVAVVDTGVDGTHPDLAGRVLPGTDLIRTGATGWDDGYGHGTHVAGIIAATAGNGIGIAGLAPAASILPVRVLDDDGAGWDGDVAAGLIWAADHGASVINLSLGGPDSSDAVSAAVSYAIGRGALVVVAAGNDRTSGNPVEYPAAFTRPGMLAVAATTRANVSASYSSSGRYVTLAAPGDGVVSTLPGNRYGTLSGTSMAAPYVAASAALLRAVTPTLTPAALGQALTDAADDLQTPGRDDETGAGLVDPGAALCRLGRCPPGVTAATRQWTWVAGSLRVVARVPAGAVSYGRSATVAVTVTDTAGPVPGALVRLGAPAGAGTSGSAVTGADGVARVAVVPVRGGSWTTSATAAGHASGRGSVVLRVAPAVSVRRTGRQVTIVVSPASGQLVTLDTGTTGGWVRVGSARLATGRSGTVRLTAPDGPVQVGVSAAAGLSAVSLVRGS
jgi:type VII secretion-associated serine protease mycosin